ncbi:MAG TPA: glycosyltransferase family 2 protein [Thermoleophilaceae bacterium]|jgi:glycosyltransferase involved in cell wall biosynthesis
MVRGLSIVLPAYNEEQNVRTAVERALGVLEQVAEDYEVIVVDDGSSDGTSDVVRSLVDEHGDRVRLIVHETNIGYGAAIRTGFDCSRYEFVFYTDSDNQFDVAELEYFLPFVEEHDVVIGFRVYRYDTVLRSIMSWVYNRLVGVLFRTRVRDVDCAFKLMRRQVLDHLSLECDNFFIDTELVARARKWNYRIAQKGVRHYPRLAGATTVRPSDVPNTLREVLRMWQRIYFPTRAQLEQYAAHEQHRRARTSEYVPAAVGS